MPDPATRMVAIYSFYTPESCGGFIWAPDTPLGQLELLATLENELHDYDEQTILTLEVPNLDGEELTEYIDSILLDGIETRTLGNVLFTTGASHA